ncbi:MAG TPA: hypothetical protein VFT27_08845 [Actinomycetota bacterium]|nr:hypothetical protein [Actinomycetota bacterium]
MIEATFVVIGDDGEEQRIGPGEPAGGDVVIYDETLYEEDAGNPGYPDKDKPVGSAHSVCVLTPSRRAISTIVLRLDGPDSVTAHGLLPFNDDDQRVGDGVIPVTGGTGRFRNFHGEMEVTVVNPHKYRVTG